MIHRRGEITESRRVRGKVVDESHRERRGVVEERHRHRRGVIDETHGARGRLLEETHRDRGDEETHRDRRRVIHRRIEVKKETWIRRLIHPSRRDKSRSFKFETVYFHPSTRERDREDREKL